MRGSVWLALERIRDHNREERAERHTVPGSISRVVVVVDPAADSVVAMVGVGSHSAHHTMFVRAIRNSLPGPNLKFAFYEVQAQCSTLT